LIAARKAKLAVVAISELWHSLRSAGAICSCPAPGKGTDPFPLLAKEFLDSMAIDWPVDSMARASAIGLG